MVDGVGVLVGKKEIPIRITPFVSDFRISTGLTQREQPHFDARYAHSDLIRQDNLHAVIVPHSTSISFPLDNRLENPDNIRVKESTLSTEVSKGSQTPCQFCKQVMPAKVLTRLDPVVTTWCKHWSFECGHCGREVARFSILPRVRCPYCRVMNNMRKLYASTGY